MRFLENPYVNDIALIPLNRLLKDMKNQITQLSDLDMNGSYTYTDYLTWRLEEMVELIKGKIFKMSPAPNTFHQTVSGNLFAFLKAAIKEQKYKTFSVPTDLRLTTKGMDDVNIITVVQPDIFVVCDPAKLDDRGCLGSPDLIIEILSPATATKDLTKKFDLYQESGVHEYWIVFPGDRIVETFYLENRVYKKTGVYAEDAMVPVRTLPGLEILVTEIFEN